MVESYLVFATNVLFQSRQAVLRTLRSPKNNCLTTWYSIDEFETFNDKVWTERHELGWVNNELQEYRPENVLLVLIRVNQFSLLLPRKGNNIYSGRVNSQGKMNFRTGRIEASIKLPKTANGLWPAFWMMGDNGKTGPPAERLIFWKWVKSRAS